MTYILHNGRDPSCPCEKCEARREAYRNPVSFVSFGSVYKEFMSGGVAKPSELGAIPPLVIHKPLEVRVADDVEAIMTSFAEELWEFKGKEELPDTRDLTKYVDAYESAVRHCIHENIPQAEFYIQNTVYCPDCKKYYTQQEVWQARKDGD